MEHHKPVFPLPSEGELVDFPHGAAGHQGLSLNASGDLIIKPCTQAEIDFYEAAKDHPAFQAHMPVYVGKLELGNKAAVPFAPQEADPGLSAEPQEAEVTQVEEREQPEADDKKKRRQTKVWVPSGGKKIETGLAIALENAAASFKKPNVIDLKLGSRLWADDAPKDKRQKLDQVAAETTSGSLGFRVAGAKIWLGDMVSEAGVETNTEIKDGYKSYNKHYGRNLDEQSVHKAIARFLSGTIGPLLFARDKSRLEDEAVVLTKRLIRELENIEHVLEHEESRMYSASVLIVIEGDPEALEAAMTAEEELQEKAASEEITDTAAEAGEDDDEADENDDDDEEGFTVGPKVMEVRLIDFAHAAFTPGQGPDENALMGIRNIIKILKEIST